MRHLPLQTAIALALAIVCCAQWAPPTTKRASRPNILVILVDDQDFHLGSMDHMDQLQSQLVQQGTLFTKHYGHVSQWYAPLRHPTILLD